MRKVLVPIAALVLCAAPVAAQQAPVSSLAADQAEVVKQAPAQAQPVEETQTPRASLAVGTDEVRQHVRATEEQRSEAQMGNQGFWWTVAAVAIGVIVALLLLD